MDMDLQIWAAKLGMAAILPLLAKNSPSNIDATDSSGCTALYMAAVKGDCDVLSILLQCGSNPTICDSQGKSPREAAEESGHDHCHDRLKMVGPLLWRIGGDSIQSEAWQAEAEWELQPHAQAPASKRAKKRGKAKKRHKQRVDKTNTDTNNGSHTVHIDGNLVGP